MKRLNPKSVKDMLDRCATEVRDWMLEQGAMSNGYESRMNLALCDMGLGYDLEQGEFEFPKNDSPWHMLTEMEREARLEPLIDYLRGEVEQLPDIAVAFQLRVLPGAEDQGCYTTVVRLDMKIDDFDVTLDSEAVRLYKPKEAVEASEDS